ncbi:MAG: DNA polymerase III subunit alpha [Planctomycetes bacterium]|nr:DNA polymerase III subunit alpha [Planctomycetota bacterium]
MKFVHLHVHTHYSLLDGLTKIDELIQTAKDDGAPAVAMTDHGVMYGAVEFYQKCRKAGIKPIIGMEAYLASGSRLDKVSKDDEKRNYHLLLLAKDITGYKNLLKLTSLAHLEGFYYKPRIDWESLTRYHEGLIACTACIGGEIPLLIRAGKKEKARVRLREYSALFGPDNFYLEIMDHPSLAGQPEVNRGLIEFSRELGLPLVATNDVHYLKKEDDEAQDILLCLQNKKKRDETDRMNMTGEDYSYRSASAMIKAFAAVPEAVANTLRIAERCNLEIELGRIQLPYFAVPAGYDGDSLLKEQCEAGLLKRYRRKREAVSAEIVERLDYELSVIKSMGWPSYFLIVADFVNWAKNNGIVVGPGRGSAAGSLVCYLTGITNIDPLKYELLFERFLNPDRVSMPDIDMDFSDVRRDEVIRYVGEKYGHDHVAQIITFGTMAARASVRDVGRVLGYPYDYCDRLAKMIPLFSGLDKALTSVNELREIYHNEEGARRIVDYARRLEGVARHASTHACGVVITKDPLTEQVPLQYASSADMSIVSQYSLHPIEDLGLLKMDFLGLKNLTIIESAIKIIKNTRGLAIDIDAIPLSDQAAYRLFQDGETTGVFQFESSGMKRYLKELKPTEFEDIIAMVALYRPGPMEWIPDYIAGKQGKKTPFYLHPKLEPILKKTYGVAIYQEQVMQMARSLAGFTMAEADVLRKAVGKKIPKLLAEQKEKFVDGCVRNGIASGLAEKIFSFIEPFAGYGFNRSHAACYALIAYQTAYLKSHWPAEFMAALLTADQQNIDRIAVEIEECQRIRIRVAGPDINQSFGSFTVVTSGTAQNAAVGAEEKIDTIRFGLKAVKNIGEHIADVVISERKANGVYRDMSDFLERIADKDLNKKSLESLIKSGSLDEFGERGLLLGNMDSLLDYNKEITKSNNHGQVSLFADAPQAIAQSRLNLSPRPPAGRQEKLVWEKELLGLYITEHPFADFAPFLSGVALPLRDAALYLALPQVTVAGVITKVQKIVTRTNESMLFVKIEDTTAGMEVLVFPRLLKEAPDIWQENKAVICQGRLSDKDQEIKLLANRAGSLTVAEAPALAKKFKINSSPASGLPIVNGRGRPPIQPTRPSSYDGSLKIVFNHEPQPGHLAGIKQIFSKYQGNQKVLFKVKEKGRDRVIETAFRVNNSPDLAEELRRKIGAAITVLD